MLLQVRNLNKAYGRKTVVNGISFYVDRGEIVGLLGRNGAGKTTTFRIVVGLVKPLQGKVYLNDNDITNMPIYKRARSGMGFLPQEPSVFVGLTVEENLLAILEFVEEDRKQRKKIALSLLEEYGLIKLAKNKAFTLSGGERRRLEICRTMITSPSIVLFDEPFTGVDPIAISELKQTIKRLKEKDIGVLLTDHNVRETLSITDRSYIIDEGNILCEGDVGNILENSLVKERYLGSDFKL
jgi:lipopolysaccharide export system ATP-binding protein